MLFMDVVRNEKMKRGQIVLPSLPEAKTTEDESQVANTVMEPSERITHDLNLYTPEQFRKHFDGTAYDYGIELDLKYTRREVYQEARIAHENRRYNLERGIPEICQEFLDSL